MNLITKQGNTPPAILRGVHLISNKEIKNSIHCPFQKGLFDFADFPIAERRHSDPLSAA